MVWNKKEFDPPRGHHVRGNKVINVYVLYNNNARSESLLRDCKESLDNLPNNEQFNFIPVLGYQSEDAISLYADAKIPVIPYYKDLLASDLTTEFRKELNGAMCATMGHAKIWELISESVYPSIILEHDAVFKTCNFNLTELEDFMIYWLGPRTVKMEDYAYPSSNPPSLLEVKRFEGVHAYAITPKTAKYLLSKWRSNGFVDSIDGCLAMRNYYSLTMVVMDPPPVVAVVNRDGANVSTIGTSPATWNAKNMPGFISGLSTLPPPERLVEFENKDFICSFPWVSMNPPKMLAFTNDDGTAIKVLSNQLLSHMLDCKLDYICPADKYMTNQFKSYFSNYYYKINCLGSLKTTYKLVDELLNQIDVSQYSFAYIDCKHLDDIDTLHNCLRLLQHIDFIMVYFDKKSDKFIGVLEEMGFTCRSLGTLVCIKK